MLLTKTKQLLGTHVQDGYVSIGGTSYHTLLTTCLYAWIDANNDDLIRWQVTKQLSGGIVTRLDWYNSTRYKLTVTHDYIETPYDKTDKSTTSVYNYETDCRSGSFIANYDNGGNYSATFRWDDNWYPFDENAVITVANVTMPPKMTGSFTTSATSETTMSLTYTFPVSVSRLVVQLSLEAFPREFSVSGTTGTVTLTGCAAGENIGVSVIGYLADDVTYITCPTRYQEMPSYPYAYDIQPFHIQQTVTIPIYNPYSRSVTVKLMSDDTQLRSVTTTGTSVSFNTGTFRSTLYGLLGSANSAPYYVIVSYLGNETYSDDSYFELELGYTLPSISLTGTRGTIASPDPVSTSVQLKTAWSIASVANNSIYSPCTVIITTGGTTTTRQYSFSGSGLTSEFLTTLTDSLDSGKEYRITLQLYDSIGYSRGVPATATITLPKSIIPVSIYDDDNGDVGMAIGQMAVHGGLTFAKGQNVYAFDSNGTQYMIPAIDLVQGFGGGGREHHTSGGWEWFEYDDGYIEAYYLYTAGSTSATLWGNQTYYKDFTIGSFPSGLRFTSTPHFFATCNNNQWWVAGISGHSTTSGGTVRLGKPTSGAQAVSIMCEYKGY